MPLCQTFFIKGVNPLSKHDTSIAVPSVLYILLIILK